MEEEKGIKDNVEEVKENLQVGPSLTAGAEPREEGSMVLRTEDLVKKYGKRTVVSHVSIDVKQGEIVGLLGPNGAGKTTSFYMTVGLITPNEGRIFLNDLDITKYPVYKRAQTGIGYLAQEASVINEDPILLVSSILLSLNAFLHLLLISAILILSGLSFVSPYIS